MTGKMLPEEVSNNSPGVPQTEHSWTGSMVVKVFHECKSNTYLLFSLKTGIEN